MSPPRTFKAQIFGRVQGVGFRFFVQRRARLLGLRGYVQNKPDGTVEVFASGPEEVLRSFIEEDLKKGPPASWVRSCRVEWIEKTDLPSGFVIL